MRKTEMKMNVLSRTVAVILLCMFLLPVSSWAERVSFDRARDIAFKVLQSGYATKGGLSAGTSAVSSSARVSSADSPKGGDELRLVWDGLDPVTRGESSQNPPFYVFARESGGFVVVPGSDVLGPVIARSDCEKFDVDSLPPALEQWFEAVRKIVAMSDEKGFSSDEETAGKWDAISGAIPSAVETFAYNSDNITAGDIKWNQRSPYNNKCPYWDDESGRSCTGCTNTALSIVMRFHKHGVPSGTLPSYTYTKQGNTRTVEALDISSHVYDWSLMPLKTGDFTTTDQKDAVSTLMYDVGVSLKAAYSYSGTGTSFTKIPSIFVSNFGYAPSIQHLYRSSFTYDQWMDLIRNEIDGGRPIVYSGYNSDGSSGHAFVLCGYDSDDNLYVNWGWGGSSNGWYDISLNVSSYDFGYSQDGIFGMAPVGDAATAIMRVKSFSEGTYNNIYLPNAYVRLKAANFKSANSKNFCGQLGYRYIPLSGDSQDVVFYTLTDTLKASYYYSSLTASFYLPSTIAAGDRFVALYRENSEAEWKECAGDNEFIVTEDHIARKIEDVVRVKFDRGTSKLTVYTGVGMKLVLSDGTTAKYKAGAGSTSYTRDVSSYSGTYNLKIYTLLQGGGEVDPVTWQITL